MHSTIPKRCYLLHIEKKERDWQKWRVKSSSMKRCANYRGPCVIYMLTDPTLPPQPLWRRPPTSGGSRRRWIWTRWSRPWRSWADAACWRPAGNLSLRSCECVSVRLPPETKIIRLQRDERDSKQGLERESSTTAHMNLQDTWSLYYRTLIYGSLPPVSYILQNYEWPLTLISSQQI